MGNSLEDLRGIWESWSEEDPFWAVLSDPKRAGGRWNPDEFFATGHREIETVAAYLQSIGKAFPSVGPALDFGCGLGRLTRALGNRLNEVVGVDIAQGMVDRATQLNAHLPSCSFLWNTADTLPFPADQFTFIYSSIALQHIPRPFADSYIREFVRTLRPGGIAVFQVFDSIKADPQTSGGPWQALKSALRLRTRLRQLMGLRKPQAYSMNVFPEQDLQALLHSAGAQILGVSFTNSTDADFNGDLRYLAQEPSKGAVSRQYAITKS